MAAADRNTPGGLLPNRELCAGKQTIVADSAANFRISDMARGSEQRFRIGLRSAAYFRIGDTARKKERRLRKMVSSAAYLLIG